MTSQLKVGTAFMYEGNPLIVQKMLGQRSGRAGMVTSLRVKNLVTNSTMDLGIDAGEKFDEVDLESHVTKLSYIDGETFVFMDQDTYEQLMTMEDKEIRFWKAHPEFEIPFLSECDMNWDEIVGDYDRRMKEEEKKGINEIRNAFNEAFEALSYDEKVAFAEDGDIPKSISAIADIDPKTGNFVSKKYPEYVLMTLSDLIESISEYNVI